MQSLPEKLECVWFQLQTLLETHMGMTLDAMQQWRDLTPAERGTQSLPGAHLPIRGFYRIKSINSSQLQKQRSTSVSFCGIPFWVSQKPQNDSSEDLSQPRVDADLKESQLTANTALVQDAEDGQAVNAEVKLPVDM